MRKISFKGKRVDNNEWEYGYLCRYGFAGTEKYYIIPYYASDLYGIEVDPETVGQFTGSYDKNEKGIFEGDICKYNNYIGLISFDEEKSMFIFTYGGDIEIYFSFISAKKLEVIGNIHDKPELLEVQ